MTVSKWPGKAFLVNHLNVHKHRHAAESAQRLFSLLASCPPPFRCPPPAMFAVPFTSLKLNPAWTAFVALIHTSVVPCGGRGT